MDLESTSAYALSLKHSVKRRGRASPTSSLQTHGMPVSSWITAPSFASATPSAALASLPGFAFFICTTTVLRRQHSLRF